MASLDQNVTLHSFEHMATIHVRVSRFLTVRTWLALRLIALAAWIADLGFE